MDNKKDMTRRDFVKSSGIFVGGIVGGSVLGGLIGPKIFNEDEQTGTIVSDEIGYNQALMYFTNMEDFNALKAATERIFPADDERPGAIDLLVPFYIDHQLAGSYGHNNRVYMQGPFHAGEPTQGYQTHLKRNEIFDIGIRGIHDHSQKSFNEKFVDLEPEQQDEVLTAFENDEVKLAGISSSFFFSLLRDVTLEGIYADPLYGGNNNMEGWKMKEYPGDQMSYLDYIEAEEFIQTDIEPSSLKDHHN